MKDEVKNEKLKGEDGVKSEIKSERGVKHELVKTEGGKAQNTSSGTLAKNFDCYINKIDTSNRSVDFASIPEDIVKNDLLSMGIRVCTLKKK